MKIDYRGSSKILKRLAELVNRSQNIALRQDTTDKNVLYWTDLDGVEITINIPSGSVEVDAELSETSTNPVENQAITKELAKKSDKSDIPAVGNGTLSVQRNGKSVGTFSANAAKNTAINIPVPEKVSELENDAGYTKNTGTYIKPSTGIPKSDLASGVQASLDKADTALQKHQDISGKLDKTGDASNTTVAFSAASARENVKTGEKLSVIVGKIAKWFADLKTVAFTGSYNDLANKPTIPDISGKQDKSTAVTHTANTAVGSATKPVYIAANGTATAISHSINSDVPANAKFTDTTYNDATQSAHGLMAAADKKKLDGMDLSKYLPKDGTAKKAEMLSSGQMRTAYCHNDDATFSNGYVWFKIGTATLSGGYSTVTTTFLGIFGYGNHALYTCRIRLSSAGNTIESITFLESGKSASSIPSGIFRVVAINGEKSVTFELWAKGKSRWEGTRVVILNEMNLAGGSQSNFWTLTSRGNADAKLAPTSGNMYVNSGDDSYCKTASKSAEATAITETAWTAVPATGAAATVGRSIKYLKSGNTVFVQGAISFNASLNTPVCGTMPSDCLPNRKLVFTGWDIIGAPEAFAIILDTDGKLSFLSPGTTAYWFKDHKAYNFNFSYHIN